MWDMADGVADPEEAESRPDHPYNPDRNRGILTRNDREWIVNRPEDLNESTKRQKHQRIRDRLHQSIIDATILLEHMDYSDLQQAFEPRGEREVGARVHFLEAIDHMLGLIYLGYLDDNGEATHEDQEGGYFEHSARSGIEQALNRIGYSVESLDVSIEVERGARFEEIVDELADQSHDTLFQLYQAGEISGNELTAALDAQEAESNADEE